MKSHLTFTIFFLLSQLFAQAQMKVGDNPTTINGASLLELETTNMETYQHGAQLKCP